MLNLHFTRERFKLSFGNIKLTVYNQGHAQKKN